jgi:hypothetical protein
VDELRRKMLDDYETKEIAQGIVTGLPKMTLNHIQDSVNNYISTLMDQDDHIRVKDTMPMDETKFTLEIKPIHLLIL